MTMLRCIAEAQLDQEACGCLHDRQARAGAEKLRAGVQWLLILVSKMGAASFANVAVRWCESR